MPHRYDAPEQNSPARDSDRQGKLGWGSLSLPLVVLALVWSFRIGGFCLGDAVLGALSLPAWSDGGTHIRCFTPICFWCRPFCWASGSAGSCLPAPAAGLPAFCWRRSRCCMC